MVWTTVVIIAMKYYPAQVDQSCNIHICIETVIHLILLIKCGFQWYKFIDSYHNLEPHQCCDEFIFRSGIPGQRTARSSLGKYKKQRFTFNGRVVYQNNEKQHYLYNAVKSGKGLVSP